MAQKKKSAAVNRRSPSGAVTAKNRKNTSAASRAGSAGKSSSGKRTGGSRGTGTRSASGSSRRAAAMKTAKKKAEQQQREIRADIALIVLLLVMLFLYLSLLGLSGSVGEILSRILCGLFGRAAWGIPLWLFALCLYLMNGTGGRQMPVRLCASALLLLVIGAAFHLNLHAGNVLTLETSYDIQRAFSVCAERSDGGGVINGFFAWLLYRAFGFTGSILVDAGLIVIGLILLLQKSPAGLLRGWQERRQEAGRPGLSERRELHRQRRLEEMEAREEARLERETSRILERESERAAREAARRKNRSLRTTGASLDLEHTLLEDMEPAKRTGRRKRNPGSSSSRNPAYGSVQTDRRRDVHEITLMEDYTEREGTAPEKPHDRRENKELFMIHGRSLPDPEGTTFHRPAEAASGPEPVSPEEVPATDPGPSSLEVAADPAGSFSRPGGIREIRPGEAPSSGTDTAGPGPLSDPHQAASAVRDREKAPLEAGPAGPASGSASGSGSPSAKEPAGALAAPTEQDLSGIAVHRDSGTGKSVRAGRTAAAGRGGSYVHPPYDLLDRGAGGRSEETERELRETAYQLQETLRTFGVQVKITDISQGPSVTRYELMPDQGVKVSRIVNLSDDIKLRLAATDIRIEAPIPGKSAIGIEVPNKHESTVHLRELLETRAFKRSDGKLPFAVGKDIGGKTVIADIARMPHLLIAGATGSGKSVCINTIILSILYRTSPEDVRLLMIDPKVVELSVYKRIPHLIIPVVTDARKASAALNWAVAEMEKRYKLFAAAGVRDLNGYNTLAKTWLGEDGEPEREPLPRLVIIVDELADLMMVAKSEVESAICRLAQLARAAGIHLIIATQRPSVDVITGLIKANMPSRIAFAVSSQVDSRTILDMAGAEKLIGRGDMLFYPQNYQKPARIQGAFVSDEEVTRVVDYIRQNNHADTHDREIDRQIDDIAVNGLPAAGGDADVRSDPSRDEHFAEAGRFIIEKNKASIGLLQRVFKIGFNRAARIMDQLAEAGVVSEESSTRARQVLMSMPEFEAWLEENMN